MKNEEKILIDYLTENKFKFTSQRKAILDVFLAIERHVSAEELYEQLKGKHLGIGLATVYRTLNLLSKCGLAKQREFGDGQNRYEHVVDHRHHDHLVCEGCGKIAEFENSHIEMLQEEVAREKGYIIFDHKLELYGVCSDCTIEGKHPQHRQQ